MIDGVRKYMLNGEQIEHSMQELDKTVASLGERCDNMYTLTPTRRRRREATDDDRTQSTLGEESYIPQRALGPIYMNSQLIDNIDTIKCKSHFSRMSSSCSRKSMGTKGSRLSRSISSRSSRRRGASLERSISQVILQTADSDTPEASIDIPDSASNLSTDDILKDLIQADAVWAAEVGSAFNLLPPIDTEDEPELLPPIQVQIQPSSVPDEWQPNFDDLSFPPTPRSLVLTSFEKQDRNASDGSSRLAKLEKSSITEETYPETVNVSDDTFEPVFVNKVEQETLHSLFGDDPFGNVHFSEPMSQLPSFGQTGEGKTEWMPFDDNPFHDDTISQDSPSSVADFSRVVDRVPTNKSDSWLGVSTKGSF